MPTVPRISDSRIQSTGIPSVKRTAPSTEESYGGGATTQKTFESAKDLATATQKIIAEQQKQANTLAVLDASSKLSSEENRLLYDPQRGAFLKRGQDAFDLPEQVMKDYDKTTADIENGLANNDQKLAFRRQAVAHRASLDEQVQRHVATQIRQYDADATQSYVANERQAAALNAADLSRIALSLDRQAEALTGYKRRNGLPDEWLKASIAEATSKTHRGVGERMLSTGDPRAEDYIKSIQDQLQSEDVDLLDKVRREVAQRQKIQQDQLEQQLYVQMMDRTLTLEQAKGLLEAGKIDRHFYGELESRFKKINDDDSISVEDKAAKFFEMSQRFAKLHGARVDIKGQPKAPAKGNRLDQLKAFRAEVAKAAPYLTDEQERNFYLYTQRNLTTAQASKAGVIMSALRGLSALSSPAHVLIASASGLLGLMHQGTTPDQAATTAQAIVNEATVSSNPNRTRYQVGQILTNANGLQAEVTGFDATGDPILKWKR